MKEIKNDTETIIWIIALILTTAGIFAIFDVPLINKYLLYVFSGFGVWRLEKRLILHKRPWANETKTCIVICLSGLYVLYTTGRLLGSIAQR